MLSFSSHGKGKAMRRLTRSCRWLAAACAMLLATVSTNAAEVSIHSIFTNPAQYDGQTVTLRGAAVAVKETVSRRGNDYTTFKLQDPSGEAISIFAWGHPALANSDRVEVVGVFQQVRHVGRYTFYNEVEAQSVSPAR